MTYHSRERPGIFPAPEILLTLAERDPHCTCTWVGSGGGARFALKYRNLSCPSVTFHRELDMRTP